ncbi:thrombospondin-1-like [Styela clava]
MKILQVLLAALACTAAAAELGDKVHDVFTMTNFLSKMREHGISKYVRQTDSYNNFLPAYRFRRPTTTLDLTAVDSQFRSLAEDISQNQEFVLLMSLRNDFTKKGTLLSVTPKDEIDTSGDFLEIVTDPVKGHLSVFGFSQNKKFVHAFETGDLQQEGAWTNFSLWVTTTKMTLYHNCDYVGQFSHNDTLIPMFDVNKNALHLATGFKKAKSFRGSLARIRFYVGATVAEVLAQETRCTRDEHTKLSRDTFEDIGAPGVQPKSSSVSLLSDTDSKSSNNMVCDLSCDDIRKLASVRPPSDYYEGKPVEVMDFPRKSCWDDTVRYDDGEQWKRDDCQVCNCTAGKVTCVVEKCNALPCIDVVEVEGQCCPECASEAIGYSQWSEWTACSVTCGIGQQQRGRACDKVHFTCDLKTKESRNCVLEPCDRKVKLDGGWSYWSPWGPCSVSCGEGVNTRIRECNAPAPQLGGKDCEGASRENKVCFQPHCPIDGEWGPYSPYSLCSATCGEGTKERTRTCDNPAPMYGGKYCSGKETDTVTCNDKPCPIHGKWSPWSKYGPCTASCGRGQKTRVRSCNNPAPEHGGEYCEGDSSEVRDCKGDPCPIDGGWGPYTPFSRCSATCGGGFKKRTRECNNPAPLFGGKYCVGDKTNIESCSEKTCPINNCLRNPCYPGVTCTPHDDGSYECGTCPEGMQGDGGQCEDIDECKLVPDACFHYEGKHRCQNYPGGYSCMPCPMGHKGDIPTGTGVEYAIAHKQECVVSNPCTDGTNPCSENAECIFLDPTITPPFMCKCHPGYSSFPECRGFVCLEDADLDGIPDVDSSCMKDGVNITLKGDNCLNLPNSGQENADGDEFGDACDRDADNDGIVNERDNCPLIHNPTQHDSDRDRVGDVCDNCPFVRNPGQIDTDNDGLGDECDPDIDGDEILNSDDNCPYVHNPNQRDTDKDGVGDACDNCPNVINKDQSDADSDLVGDACDTDLDRDKDGVQDDLDNCPFVPNSGQADHDKDRIGDECDNDDDNDGILDKDDNCRLIHNPDQKDSDGNGRGDVCEEDFDGDNIKDFEDACMDNALITKTDFTHFDMVKLDPTGTAQIDPNWVIRNKGKEIIQTKNCDPGLAIGKDMFNGVDFEGTFYVNTGNDDDYAGFVFGYQSSSRFYVLMWKQKTQSYWRAYPRQANAEAGLQLKVVESTTGPGEYLRNALWHTGDTPGQVRTLWTDSMHQGWQDHSAYRWTLNHRPETGEIRVTMYNGKKLLTDSGRIIDRTYAGGRMGMFIFSQEMVFYSDMKYKCSDSKINYK